MFKCFLNAAVFIKFFLIRVWYLMEWHLYEGSVYLKSNLYLVNNNMETDYLN